MGYPVALFTDGELQQLAIIGLVMGLVMLAAAVALVLTFRPRYWLGGLIAGGAVALGCLLSAGGWGS